MKAAIFDMDGVLLDSMAIWVDVDKQFLGSYGIEQTDEISKHLSMLNMDQGILYMINEFSLPVSPDEVRQQLLDLVEDFYLNKVKLKNGVRDVLEAFKQQGIPMAVATSNNKELTLATLKAKHIDHYFEAVVTCDEVGKGKWATDVYDSCCQAMSVTPKETYVFEDSLHALATLYESDYTVVGVYDEYSHLDQEIIRRISTIYVKDFVDFFESLKY